MANQGSSVLVKAIEDAWKAIRNRHPDVPEVVATLGAGSLGRGGGLTLGHFAQSRWVRDEGSLHELFIGGEGLERGAEPTLGTLLHEASHGIAATRGIKDTSRQGRYHNTRFKALGEELGLELERSDSLGWSTTTLPPETVERYRAQVDSLSNAITAYRVAEFDRGGSSPADPKKNGVVIICACGRKARCSHAVFELGPIICGICDEPFSSERN